MNRVKFSIKTLSPVVMSSMSNTTIMTGTHSAFSGSIIRGVLASLYVEIQKLGDAAFQDKTFREIFYGNLKFLPANPEVSNKRSFVMPQSLQKAKAGSTNENDIQDLLTAENPKKGYKSLRGYGIVDGDKIFTATVKKNIFMHMSRTGENKRPDGKIIYERLAGRSDSGQIYNYESIDAGEIFQGEILGDEKILRKLFDGLKLNGDELTAYVGKSRFTQYGKCHFMFEKIEKVAAQNISEKMYLRLDTPLIPIDDAFISAEKILQDEVVAVLNELCGKSFKIGKVFSSGVEIENFVVPWSMKRPRIMGLAAGTVFELSTDTLTDGDKKIISDKIYDGFGTRTEEGFGQLRIWNTNTFTNSELDKETSANIDIKNFSRDTKTLAKKILIGRFLDQVRIYANDDAQKLQLHGGNFTHFFSRLESILMRTNKNKFLENFKANIEIEKRNVSLFKDHLEHLYMYGNQSLNDVFTGQAELPYKKRNLKADVVGEDKELSTLLDALEFKDFDNDCDFEYLNAYFRFARKKASGGGANE